MVDVFPQDGGDAQGHVRWCGAVAFSVPLLCVCVHEAQPRCVLPRHHVAFASFRESGRSRETFLTLLGNHWVEMPRSAIARGPRRSKNDYQIPQAPFEARVPAHAQNDDLSVEVPSFEQIFDRYEPLHLFIIAGHPYVCTRAGKRTKNSGFQLARGSGRHLSDHPCARHVAIATREQCGARRRAQRRGVEVLHD